MKSQKGTNRVTLSGKVVNDPELSVSPGGRQVANFKLAVITVYPPHVDGEYRDVVEQFQITAWNFEADNCADLKAGEEVSVSGKLRTCLINEVPTPSIIAKYIRRPEPERILPKRDYLDNIPHFDGKGLIR